MNRNLFRDYISAFNADDWNGFSKFYAEDVVLDNNDAKIGLLYHQLAVGDEDRKIHDRRLGPMLKALSNLCGVSLIDEVDHACAAADRLNPNRS